MSPRSAPTAGPLRAAAFALCLGALAAVYFWPLLRPAEPLSLGGDFAAQSYPWRHYATAALFEGRLPHWAPQVGFGFPFLADIETNVFYPVALLVSLLAGPDIPYRALELQLVLHHVIAGLGLALLLERLGCRWPAALGGAVVFAFSGFLWAHGAHLTVVQSASWGPWVLLGGRALLDGVTARAVVGTAAALGLAVLGGHPQIPVYIGLALVALVVVGRWGAPGPAGAGAAAPLARGLAAAALLAAGLTAVQLLPTAVLTRHSIRWRPTTAFLQTDTLPVENLLTFVIPLAFHGTDRWLSVDEFHGYVGVLPLILAAWALARPWSRWTLAFALLVGAGLLVALGLPPLAWVVRAGLFRAPARAVYLVDLAVAALAAFGLDALLRSSGAWSAAERRTVWALRVLAAAAAAGGVGLLAVGLPAGLASALSPEFTHHWLGFAGLMIAALIVLEAGRWLPRERWLVPGLVTALLLFETLSFPRTLAWSHVPPDGHWPPPSRLGLRPEGYGPYRVLGDRMFGRSSTMEANVGLLYAVPLPSVYTSLFLSRYASFRDAVLPGLPRTTNAYDLVGVRWIVSPRDVPAWTVGFRPAESPGLEAPEAGSRLVRVRPGLWEIRDPLPRAYLPATVRVVGDKHEALRALAALDPRQTVILDRHPALCPARSFRPPGPGDVRFLVDEPDRVRLRVVAADSGPLVLSDTYYPGWRATVDGQPTRVYRANHIFRAVCVPPGPRVVEFVFSPPGFRAGAAVTLVSGVVAVLALWAPAGLRRRLRSGVGARTGYRGLTVSRSKDTPVPPR